MDEGGSSHAKRIEFSPINPRAHRVRGGVWNEDELPVLPRELAEYRVVLPEDLQRVLGCPVPVLRRSSIKFRTIVSIHARDQHVVQELSRYLCEWAWVGEEIGADAGHRRVLIQDEVARWYAVTIGADRNKSYNVITVFGGSDRGFLHNRLRQPRNVVHREK